MKVTEKDNSGKGFNSNTEVNYLIVPERRIKN